MTIARDLWLTRPRIGCARLNQTAPVLGAVFLFRGRMGLFR